VQDLLRYDQLVETAMRGVVREALCRAADKGLPGAHHFYITFKTKAPGIGLPPHLASQYPDEMTIVLEHQFWDLKVGERDFSVTLSFANKPERLVIPFAAVTAFADPSVKFGLQFQSQPPADTAPRPAAVPLESAPAAKQKLEAVPAGKPGAVVALDAFRKK
jgi:uncharacterized protein